MPELVKTDWDSLASTYRITLWKYILFHIPYRRAYLRLLKSATFPGPLTIMELGCGPGYSSLYLTKTLPVEKLVMVDASPKMLEVAAGLFKPVTCPKTFIQGDFFNLPVNEQFDLVHSGGVIEHFGEVDRQRLLGIHAALTKPGGYCIIFVPTPKLGYRLNRRIYEFIGKWPYTDEIPLTEETLVHDLKAVGLEVLQKIIIWRFHLTEIGIIARKPLM